MSFVLALNAGSSSIKFALFECAATPGDLRPIVKGKIAQHGADVELTVKDGEDTFSEQLPAASAHGNFDHEVAINRLLAWINEHHSEIDFAAVGHRVVHGGQTCTAPVLINDAVLNDLEALIPMAPLHQPHNLRGIRIVGKHWPEVPQVACFDTTFHRTLPAVARAFALPREITAAGVVRYGFHGLSYEYIASQLPRVLGATAGGKIVVAHLGNGASLCAMVNGTSVATTMGFSALDGLVMGTRCGTLDAGVVLYLQQQLHMSVDEVSELLYQQSGLLGVSGISGDMQVLLASAESQAAEAIDLAVYRIVEEIGALAAVMGGIDALVFTAGIGERAAPIRSRICQGCGWLGAELDENANGNHFELIHAPSSRLQLAVVPTDEEYMIAAHTLQCIDAGSHSVPE